MPEQQIGVTIENGVADWQIFQQNPSGIAVIPLSGRVLSGADGVVQVRLVHEDTSAPISRALDWQAGESLPDGRWQATLRDVPAGGLYRLETRYLSAAGQVRGDMRHFLGVGDLWVIAGQSNAAGYGLGPVYDPPQPGVHMLRSSERWAMATHPLNESTETQHAANREMGNPAHSPFLAFAKLLKQQVGCPIGLIPTALGGSPLSAWNPTEPGDAPLYHNMLHCIERAGGKIKGVLWYQGESDGNPNDAPSYGQRFIQAVQAWRAALDYPDMPVLTVQLNRFYQPQDDAMDRAWTQVREAQRQMPQHLANVAVVPALDLRLTDLVHTSPDGNLLLGMRLAHAALATVYGRPLDYAAPDVQSATRRDDGRMIKLDFANVSGGMGCIDALANCFRVEDDQGEAPITALIYPPDGTIQLRLGRPLNGAAVVHGAFGRDPALVPVDLGRSLPMLGFYGVTIESVGNIS